MSHQPLPHTIVAVDMIGSGTLPNDPMLLAARSDIRAILAAVLAQQGIAYAALEDHDLGDGRRLVVPAAISPAVLVDPFLHNLNAALRQHEQRSSPVARLRLRVAIHHGLVHQDGVAAGESLRVVARLLDAAPVRRAAELAPAANLIAVVSPAIYEGVVRHGYGLDPNLFQPIAVSEKETRTTAWLYVPGATPNLPLGSPPPDDVPGKGPGVPRQPTPPGTHHVQGQAGRDIINIQGDVGSFRTGDS